MSDTSPKDDDLNVQPSPLTEDEYWLGKLTPTEYAICRQGGTERPFTGEYYTYKGDGQFVCKCCKEPLFDAATKYDSGSGWPSFYAAMNPACVQEYFDESHGMRRTEIVCRKCQCHLGHVFPDGPKPTGLRYCVNSASIELSKTDGEKA